MDQISQISETFQAFPEGFHCISVESQGMNLREILIIIQKLG